MKTKNFALLLGISIGISVGLTVFLYSFFYTFESHRINAQLEVSEKKVGFSVDTDFLNFGKVPIGGGASRYMSFKNDYLFRIKVLISWYGEISKWLSVSENNFILYPNQSKNISFNVIVPLDAEQKVYNGTVKIEFQKPLIY